MSKSKSKVKMKVIVFKKMPPKCAYFKGIPQNVPEKQADEYIKLGYAIDPEEEKKKEESKNKK